MNYLSLTQSLYLPKLDQFDHEQTKQNLSYRFLEEIPLTI
jgi:hypothetical protein